MKAKNTKLKASVLIILLIPFYACGQTSGTHNLVKTVCKETDHDLEVIFTQNGILKGFILIGDIQRLSDLKKMYLTQTVLS